MAKKTETDNGHHTLRKNYIERDGSYLARKDLKVALTHLSRAIEYQIGVACSGG